MMSLTGEWIAFSDSARSSTASNWRHTLANAPGGVEPESS